MRADILACTSEKLWLSRWFFSKKQELVWVNCIPRVFEHIEMNLQVEFAAFIVHSAYYYVHAKVYFF